MAKTSEYLIYYCRYNYKNAGKNSYSLALKIIADNNIYLHTHTKILL